MTSETSKEGDELQIRQVIDDWSRALRAKDARGVVAHHAPGFVSFSLAPPLLTRPADTTGLDAWFATWRGPIGYEIDDLHLETSGDLAFGYSLNRMSGTKTDGQRVDLWFRQTLCLRKLGGAWKIVHAHDSVPFYMDGSVRAAVDLQP
jgi:PhnB protein